MIILYILQWVLVLVLLCILILSFMWMFSTFRAKVPFVPVPTSILSDIHRALDIKEGSVVYDLGCGDGRILLHSARITPGARYIGIENNPFAAMLARVGAWWHRIRHKGSVEILQKDFFTHDLSNATHVFTYLYPKVMDDLLPKLDAELAPGTRLVSTTFKFTVKHPIAEIDLERGKYQLARKIYVYEF